MKVKWNSEKIAETVLCLYLHIAKHGQLVVEFSEVAEFAEILGKIVNILLAPAALVR